MATMHHTTSGRRRSTIGQSRIVGFNFTTPPRAGGLSLGPAAPARRARTRAAAFCVPVDFTLPGTMIAIKQTSPNTAWAAEAAILVAWRDDTPYAIDAALAKIGPQWVDKYKADVTLSSDESAALLAASGLCASPPQSLSAEGWQSMLRTFGPLLAVGAEQVQFPTRGRIVFGVTGDGLPDGTLLQFVDTTDGTRKTERLSAFGAAGRVIYWPADAALKAGTHTTAPAVPTEPAPAPVPVEPSANGRIAAPALGTSLSRARSRMRYARAAAASWDLPTNFPAVVRDFWARSSSRLHHHIWHAARLDWPNLDGSDMASFKKLGFSAPPRLAGSRGRSADPGAGLDFFAMHRQMIAATRQLAINAGIPYRPTGWAPIPFVHRDPDWPMPVWTRIPPGLPLDLKNAAMTAFYRKLVADRFENPAWLASVSLDELGTQIEESIHGWMHLHWSTDQPPDIASSDWLGHPISSQVNPHFWKLHGWIDDTIARWETAPAMAGTGPARSADAEFKKIGIWLGPVPVVKAKDIGHEHGDLTDEEAAELIAALDLSKTMFPFATLSRDELIARIGPVGDVPSEWIAEADGVPGSGDGSMMASLRGPRVPVGFSRIGARRFERQMNPAAVTAIEIGLAVFGLGRELATSGDISFQSTIADYKHPLTPPETPEWRVTTEFDVVTWHPRIGISNPHFWFELQFTANGHDLKDCRVNLLRDKSSSLTMSSLDINFTPIASSDPADPVAAITYVITGRWNPVGRGDFSFNGELKVTADGRFSLEITRADENAAWPGSFANTRKVAVPTPTSILFLKVVYFSPPRSDTVTPESERELLDWLDTQIANPNHGKGLKEGTVTIRLTGHASTTGDDTKNRDLSRRRAQKVEAIIRDRLPNAKIEITAMGEREAGTPDETEDPTQRYVQVDFKSLVWPAR